jgi:hypothetical protein
MNRIFAVVVAMSGLTGLLAPSAADACSIARAPFGMERLSSEDGGLPQLAQADAGADSQAPAQVTVSAATVTLVANACDGSGASCPELDSLEFSVHGSDDVTAAAQLRFLAAFGGTATEAETADPEFLFGADPSDPTRVRAHLGVSEQRSGLGFGRDPLCFTLAAVDEAGNVGPRSTPTCLDTTDKSAAHVTTVTGNGCLGGFGCTSTRAITPMALGILLIGFAVRRRASGR